MAKEAAVEETASQNALLTQLLSNQLEEAKKLTKKPIRPDQWAAIRGDKIPNKSEAGHAVISDPMGAGQQIIEANLVMFGTAGAECLPISGRIRGAVHLGALWTKVATRELIVLHYTPYPKTRDDGYPHIRKVGNGGACAEGADYIYPNGGPFVVEYEEYKGTFYNRNNAIAQKMLREAKKEAVA